MMKCGHAANATHKGKNGVDSPCCVICFMAPGDESTQVAEPPNLAGRMASCSYRGACSGRRSHARGVNSTTKPDYGTYDASGHSVAPSSSKLPFFEHKPNEPMDRYYCGCYGWD
jgi:hypothetical protein